MEDTENKSQDKATSVDGKILDKTFWMCNCFLCPVRKKTLSEIIDLIIKDIKENIKDNNKIKDCIKEHWFTKQIEEWKKDDNNKNKNLDDELMNIVKKDITSRIISTISRLQQQHQITDNNLFFAFTNPHEVCLYSKSSDGQGNIVKNIITTLRFDSFSHLVCLPQKPFFIKNTDSRNKNIRNKGNRNKRNKGNRNKDTGNKDKFNGICIEKHGDETNEAKTKWIQASIEEDGNTYVCWIKFITYKNKNNSTEKRIVLAIEQKNVIGFREEKIHIILKQPFQNINISNDKNGITALKPTIKGGTKFSNDKNGITALKPTIKGEIKISNDKNGITALEPTITEGTKTDFIKLCENKIIKQLITNIICELNDEQKKLFDKMNAQNDIITEKEESEEEEEDIIKEKKEIEEEDIITEKEESEEEEEDSITEKKESEKEEKDDMQLIYLNNSLKIYKDGFRQSNKNRELFKYYVENNDKKNKKVIKRNKPRVREINKAITSSNNNAVEQHNSLDPYGDNNDGICGCL